MANDTEVPKDLVRHADIPVALLGSVGAAVALLVIILLFILWRWHQRRLRKKHQLSRLTPPMTSSVTQGVKHTIDFVLPTIQISEMTEDSETDFARSYSDTEQYAARFKRSYLGRYAIEPAGFQKGLYQETHTGINVPPTAGRVGFRLQYNTARQTLLVRLLGAADLPPAFKRGTANPFAKVTLLPDKTPKFASRVQKNTLNPCFGDIFSFNVKRTQLASKTVRVAIWDHDRFSRKVLVGQACYQLKENCTNDESAKDFDTQDLWLDLLLDPETSQSRGGALLISLSYQKESGQLTCSMSQAQGLKVPAAADRDAVIYIKCALYVDKRILRSCKTPPQPRASEVAFSDETSSFSVRLPVEHDLSSANVLLICSAHCRLGTFSGKTLLGRCRLGPQCGSDIGIRHWKELSNAPSGESISRWHSLR
ncbi:synaptotagmin-3-like [Ornithodoros turicata]|uniref:synaptotagmin-3-like n=1 Tax=Ornithodoros turicata TaxID=34597 RepID=UPI00313A290A